jgi:DNA modification methylase
MIELLDGVDGIETIVKKNPVTFIHGDNMQFLRTLREEMKYKYFHVAIVDPPYGISVGSMNLGATKDSKPRTYEMGDWDNEVPTQEYWDLLNYLCRKVIVWGGNYFVSNLGQVKDLSKEVHPIVGIPNGRCFIVWDKMNDKMSFAAGELALTSFDRNSVIIRRPRNASSEDEERERRHPTQKPVYLYDYIHLNFLEKNDRVLDTHGGSFSHAIAAYKNNVNLTIIEREKSYFESGLQAYDNASQKGRLLF